MREREVLIKELWKRVASVSGVVYTARNPGAPPNVSDMPAIQFFELNDTVVDSAKRGAYIAFKRRLTVVVESFIAGTTEASSTDELAAFIVNVKRAIYSGGMTLGNRQCLIQEVESSRIIRPAAGENLIGMGLVFDIMYTEDINQLFL